MFEGAKAKTRGKRGQGLSVIPGLSNEKMEFPRYHAPQLKADALRWK